MTSLEQAYGKLMARIAQCMQDGNWHPVEASARNLAREALETSWGILSECSLAELFNTAHDKVNDQIDELGGNNAQP